MSLCIVQIVQKYGEAVGDAFIWTSPFLFEIQDNLFGLL